MPNLKIYVEEVLWAERADALIAALEQVRERLCQIFEVEPPACQLVALPVRGLPDQPLANVELSILPKPERTRALVVTAATALQAIVGAALQTHVAVRISQLDPATYVALK